MILNRWLAALGILVWGLSGNCALGATNEEKTISPDSLLYTSPPSQPDTTWMYWLIGGIIETALLLTAGILITRWLLQGRLRAEIIKRAEAERLLIEAKEAAELAANVKAEFLAHVSHDLRTPLHSILILAEVIQASPLAPEQGANLASIREAGNSLLSMVNDLLDMNRIESGRIDLSDEPFLLDDVLDPVAELLRIPARRKGVELVHWIEPGLVSGMRGDPERLRQILFNLGGNAVKFTERGHITLSAKRSDTGWLRLEVANTGPHIPADILPAIFEPFVRAVSDSKKEGSGLGLAIVRRFAEAMGGTVTVQSEKDMETIFVVDLPLLNATESEKMRTQTEGLSGKRVAVSLNTPLRTKAARQGLHSLGAITSSGAPSPGGFWLVEAEEETRARRIAEDGVKIIGVNSEVRLSRRSLARVILEIPEEETSPKVKPTSSTHLQVLLVDDDALSRRAGRALLSQIGCVVTEATGGLEALKILSEQAFHVAILDGHMPEFDGIEITSRIHSFDATHLNYGVPVIGLTADLSLSRKIRWMEAGACVVLGKPTSLRELTATIDAFVKAPREA